MRPEHLQRLATVLKRIEQIAAEAGVEVLAVVAKPTAGERWECGISKPDDEAITAALIETALRATGFMPEEGMQLS